MPPQTTIVPPPDATPRQVAEGPDARRERIAREQLKVVLNAEEGQAVLWRLLEHCHLYHAAPASVSEFERGIAEGERRVALWLSSLITEIDPAGIPTLMIAAGMREHTRMTEDQAFAAEAAKAQADETSRLNPWERTWRSISGQTAKAP